MSIEITQGFDDVSPGPSNVYYGDYTNDASPVMRVTLDAQASAGDRLQLSDRGQPTGPALTLTSAQVTQGYADIQLNGLASSQWHLLTAALSDPSGVVLQTSSQFALGVETAPPAAPVIQTVQDDAGAHTGGLADGGRTDDVTPTFTFYEAGAPPTPTSSPGHAPYGGPAVFGGVVTLYDGTTAVGSGSVGYDGVVTITTAALTAGEHELTAVTVDRAGNVSADSQRFQLTIAPDAQSAPGEQLTGDNGFDSLQGGAGDDTITGGGGLNRLWGGDGDDQITGGAGFDDINGNKGADTIDGGAGGADWLVGGQGDDLITAHNGLNILLGNLGADTLNGGSQLDVMRGGQGDDVLSGGGGFDWLSGDRGSDTITGGAGADVFHSFSGAGLDVVTDFNAADGDRVMLDPGTHYVLRQAGADAIVDMGNGDELVLQQVQLSSLPSGWIFEGW